MRENNYDPIDLIIVNFYPFEENLNVTKNIKKIIENIDIGVQVWSEELLKIMRIQQ